MATTNETITHLVSSAPVRIGGGGTTFMSMLSSLGAILAACSCCILPMALAGLGVSAGLSTTLSPLGPLRWPMTAFSVTAVAISWLVILRQRRSALACASCNTFKWLLSPRMIVLILATGFTLVAAGWSFLEPALMRALM